MERRRSTLSMYTVAYRRTSCKFEPWVLGATDEYPIRPFCFLTPTTRIFDLSSSSHTSTTNPSIEIAVSCSTTHIVLDTSIHPFIHPSTEVIMSRRWSHIGSSACWKLCLEETSTRLLRSSVQRPQQHRLVPSNFSSRNFYQQRQYHQQQQGTMMSTSTSTTLPPPKDKDHSCCYVFDPPIIPSLPVLESGRIVEKDQPQGDQKKRKQQQQQRQPSSSILQFPIHRIYCVGKNYEDHIVEMGGTVVERKKSGTTGSSSSPPVFFTKPVVDGVVVCYPPPPPPHDSHNDDGDDNGSQRQLQQQQVVVPYPSHTTNLHYEVELVVAIGRDAVVVTDKNNSGHYNYEISIDEAHNYIYGFGVGVDLTRRDLQHTSKQRGLPWDTAKYFDSSCPLGPISSIVNNIDDDNMERRCLDILQQLQSSARIELEVNGRIVQQAPVGSMIWNIVEIISELSKLYRLRKGDVILTGTPSGVGPLQIGDDVIGRIVFDDSEKDNDHSTSSSSDDDHHQMEQRFQIQPVEFVMTDLNG